MSTEASSKALLMLLPAEATPFEARVALFVAKLAFCPPAAKRRVQAPLRNISCAGPRPPSALCACRLSLRFIQAKVIWHTFC